LHYQLPAVNQCSPHHKYLNISIIFPV